MKLDGMTISNHRPYLHKCRSIRFTVCLGNKECYIVVVDTFSTFFRNFVWIIPNGME